MCAVFLPFSQSCSVHLYLCLAAVFLHTGRQEPGLSVWLRLSISTYFGGPQPQHNPTCYSPRNCFLPVSAHCATGNFEGAFSSMSPSPYVHSVAMVSWTGGLSGICCVSSTGQTSLTLPWTLAEVPLWPLGLKSYLPKPPLLSRNTEVPTSHPF